MTQRCACPHHAPTTRPVMFDYVTDSIASQTVRVRKWHRWHHCQSWCSPSLWWSELCLSGAWRSFCRVLTLISSYKGADAEKVQPGRMRKWCTKTTLYLFASKQIKNNPKWISAFPVYFILTKLELHCSKMFKVMIPVIYCVITYTCIFINYIFH